MRVATAALLLACGSALAASVPTGPNVGERLPQFWLSDQDGAPQTLDSIKGPKGAMIVFYRSADW